MESLPPVALTDLFVKLRKMGSPLNNDAKVEIAKFIRKVEKAMQAGTHEALYEMEDLPLPDDDRCPDCGGSMPWCESCQMYTKTCCVDYGTCQCS